MRIVPLPTIPIAAAGTYTSPGSGSLQSAAHLLIQAKFLYGAGGTSVKVYVQTTVDGGTTWIDIASFAFTTAAATRISKVMATTALTAVTTPTDATLTDNTVLDGVIGDAIRVKYVVGGTYTGATSLQVSVEAK